MSNIRIIMRRINGERRTLIISVESSIKELKKRVKEAYNLPEDDDIRILYISRDLYDVDPYGREQFLKDYGIKNDALVFIFARIRMSNIKILMRGINGDVRTLTISEEASIKEFKKRVKEAFDLPIDDDIGLLYTTRDLCEVDPHGNELFLKDYGITDMDLVYIIPRIR